MGISLHSGHNLPPCLTYLSEPSFIWKDQFIFIHHRYISNIFQGKETELRFIDSIPNPYTFRRPCSSSSSIVYKTPWGAFSLFCNLIRWIAYGAGHWLLPLPPYASRRVNELDKKDWRCAQWRRQLKITCG